MGGDYLFRFPFPCLPKGGKNEGPFSPASFAFYLTEWNLRASSLPLAANASQP